MAADDNWLEVRTQSLFTARARIVPKCTIKTSTCTTPNKNNKKRSLSPPPPSSSSLFPSTDEKKKIKTGSWIDARERLYREIEIMEDSMAVLMKENLNVYPAEMMWPILHIKTMTKMSLPLNQAIQGTRWKEQSCPIDTALMTLFASLHARPTDLSKIWKSAVDSCIHHSGQDIVSSVLICINRCMALRLHSRAHKLTYCFLLAMCTSDVDVNRMLPGKHFEQDALVNYILNVYGDKSICDPFTRLFTTKLTTMYKCTQCSEKTQNKESMCQWTLNKDKRLTLLEPVTTLTSIRTDLEINKLVKDTIVYNFDTIHTSPLRCSICNDMFVMQMIQKARLPNILRIPVPREFVTVSSKTTFQLVGDLDIPVDICVRLPTGSEVVGTYLPVAIALGNGSHHWCNVKINNQWFKYDGIRDEGRLQPLFLDEVKHSRTNLASMLYLTRL